MRLLRHATDFPRSSVSAERRWLVVAANCGALPRRHYARVMGPMRGCKTVEAFHEPHPLFLSFSPSGGEGARRAVEGVRFTASIRVQTLEALFMNHLMKSDLTIQL